jgi:hypothetical protein
MTSIVVKPANKHEFLLLKELFDKMKIDYKPLSYEKPEEDDLAEWYRFAMINLSRSYSDEEPEYTSEMLKEQNPDYHPILESRQ